MRQACCFIALTLLLIGSSFSQNYRDRHPFDFKKFNLGLQIGLTYNDYNLNQQINVGEGPDTLRGLSVRPRPGVSLGMITNLNLGRQVSLRAVPSITLEQRDLVYQIGNPQESAPLVRKVDPAYFNLPVTLQWKTSYWRRLRFYVLTGAQLSVNLVRTEEVRDDPNLIKLTRSEGALVFGFGVNMYGDKVKFSPEIRYKMGFTNVYVPENTSFATAISRLTSQMISLNFNFE